MEKSPGKLVLELELLERWASFVKDVLRPLQTKYMHRMHNSVFGFHNSVNEREWENLRSKNGIEPAQFWIPSIICPKRTRNGIRKHQKSGKLVVVRNI